MSLLIAGEDQQPGETATAGDARRSRARDAAAVGGVGVTALATTQVAAALGVIAETGLGGAASRVAVGTAASALELARRMLSRRRRLRALLTTPPRRAWLVESRDVGVPPSPLARRWSDDGTAPYVPRDHDARLEAMIRAERVVVVVGGDDAGKRRSALSAAATAGSDLRVLSPAEPASGDESPLADVLALDAVAWRARSELLLLFRLDRHLAPGRVDVRHLARWLDRNPERRIVATMHATAYERYVGSHSLDLPGSDAVQWAVDYPLPVDWSDDELARAACTLDGFDPALGSLSVHLGRDGRRLRRWRNADQASPEGAAVTRAAIDCVRANGGGPVAVEVLRGLFPSYIDEMPLDASLDELFDRGLEWATDARDRAPLLTRAASETVALTVARVLVDDVAETGAPVGEEVLQALRDSAFSVATRPPCRGRRPFAAG